MSDKMTWGLLTIILALAAGVSRADRLHLRNGQVKIGKLVKRGDGYVDFRISGKRGKITLVKRIPTLDIVKIERNDDTETPPAQPTSRRSVRPTTTSKTELKAPIKDKSAFLDQALAKINNDKPISALRDLKRLVDACKNDRDELARLDDHCRKKTDQPLDELMASTRVSSALDRSASRFGRLTPTRFERDAIIREIAAVIDDYRSTRVGGTSIDAELDAPESFDAKLKDARDFAKHIAKTRDLVKELSRLSPRAAKRGKSAKRSGSPNRGRRSSRVNNDESDRHDRKRGSDRETDDRIADSKGLIDPAELRRRLSALYEAVHRVARGGAPSREDEELDEAERPDQDDRDFDDDEAYVGPGDQRRLGRLGRAAQRVRQNRAAGEKPNAPPRPAPRRRR